MHSSMEHNGCTMLVSAELRSVPMMQAHCCFGARQVVNVASTANIVVAVSTFVHTHCHVTQLL